MKKRFGVCLLMVLIIVVISGCSSASSNKKNYTKVIDSALKANKELVKKYDWEKDDLFVRKQSNIMIWENENNYYVYFVKNVSDEVYGDSVYGDGYKIAKTNDSWDSSPKDRAKIKSFLDENISPVYEESNIKLVSDNNDMR